MKPCPFCTAAVPDDVTFTPGSMFCGACGRNAQQVQMAPTLPPGAAPFAPPQAGYQPPPPGYGAPQPTPPPGAQGWQAPLGGQQAWQPQPGPQIGNPQGWQAPPAGAQNNAGTAPPGLNWGAFLLPFVWGPANNVWIGLASLIGLFGGVFGLASLGVSIYLLIKGNEMAWKAKPWQSVEQFQAAQKPWIMWGVIAVVIEIVISVMRAAQMAQAGYGGYHYF